jgi:hypothetical protein
MLVAKHRTQNVPTLSGITGKTEDDTKCPPYRPADIESINIK